MSKFKELLKISFKSEDTEEWLDVYFTRPIGLVFALLWNKLGVHPNVITILSIFLGMLAGWMFYYPDLYHNICGVAFLMLANFCDSTDGQMARITGKKTLIGRMLDGFASDVWFFCVYVAISLRLMNDTIPFTDVRWGVWIWVFCTLAGVWGHARQAALADYYRQVHLFFLLGKDGSELNSYREQRNIYEQARRDHNWTAMAFYYNYANYCHGQEKRTPQCQQFLTHWRQHPDEQVRKTFLAGSRPLMPYTNILTHNTRAIALFVSALINLPWLYPLFELTVLQGLLAYMHHKHEALCSHLTAVLSALTAHRSAKNIIFDFGGTLDTHGSHWSKVFWSIYQQNNISITEEQFREAYIYTERTLGKQNIIQKDFSLKQTLATKINIQLDYLKTAGYWQADDKLMTETGQQLANAAFQYTDRCIKRSADMMERLSQTHRIALVTNFYGNIQSILHEYGIDQMVKTVIESAEVGIRKPDPGIFALALKKLEAKAEDCLVVGDSYDKDIVPAKSLGCQTVWLKGPSWQEPPTETPAADHIITQFQQLKEIIQA